MIYYYFFFAYAGSSGHWTMLGLWVSTTIHKAVFIGKMRLCPFAGNKLVVSVFLLPV